MICFAVEINQKARSDEQNINEYKAKQAKQLRDEKIAETGQNTVFNNI